MTGTIAYDQSVKNLIDALSATGHVTHTAYRKDVVTIHHNGGRLSHEGCLEVWKVRPASAHFDVDGKGALAQYVKPNEYAWATGNTEGNKRSISIEMANATLSPDWNVAEVTWKSAARLAGWLFARVIGARPTSATLVPHHHWSSTECAGPYMDSVWSQVLAEAQHWYDVFTTPAGDGGSTRPTKPPVHISPSPSNLLRYGDRGDAVRKVQDFLRHNFPAYKDSVSWLHGQLIGVDGVFGHQTEAWVREFQRRTGILADGIVGPQTRGKMRNYGFRG